MAEESLTDDEVKARMSEEFTRKLEMVVIDGHIWQRGPDGLWYRLASAADQLADD